VGLLGKQFLTQQVLKTKNSIIMEKFPVELRQVILQVMDLPTLKAMRLTSKAWAGIGEEYLVSPKFTSLPHRDDMNRLLAMSSHPKYSYRIESLFFLLGEVNEYHARHNTYFLQYMRDSEEWSHTSEEAWARYNQYVISRRFQSKSSWVRTMITLI